MIEKNGLKFTKQRDLLLKQFLIADRHLSAEEIYERLKNNNIGLATVYRNVKIFSSMGIVKEIVVDGVSYYELKIYSKKPLHLHFQCVKCNDIIDIDEREIALEYLNLNRAIEDMNDQTFQNIIDSARRKVAIALTQGNAIRISGGHYILDSCQYRCLNCGEIYRMNYKQSRYVCPSCGSSEIVCGKRNRFCYRRGRK